MARENAMRALIALAAALAMAGCATPRISDAERLALHLAHAGAPVSQIRYFNPMGWGRVDGDHLVLDMRPNQSWLIRVSGGCLDWGHGITLGISSSTGWVSTRFDRVYAQGAQMSCVIQEIRPIDRKALRAAENALRAQSVSGT
jgi:hypothetical protein